METIFIFNKILAIATIVGMVFAVKLIFVFLFRKKFQNNKFYRRFIDKKIWLRLGLLFSFLAVAITLTYSELIGFPPCRLCWFQRSFMYPSFLILLYGVLRKEILVAPFIQAISAGGMIIAAFHYLVQMSPAISTACGAAGTSCSVRFVFEFGFITIPFMSFVTFLTIFLLMSFRKG